MGLQQGNRLTVHWPDVQMLSYQTNMELDLIKLTFYFYSFSRSYITWGALLHELKENNLYITNLYLYKSLFSWKYLCLVINLQGISEYFKVCIIIESYFKYFSSVKFIKSKHVMQGIFSFNSPWFPSSMHPLILENVYFLKKIWKKVFEIWVFHIAING